MIDEISYHDIYKDNREHARHHESQRTTMSNLILIITAATSGIISIDKQLNENDLPMTVFIIFLGLFGVIFSIKYGFRISYHLDVSREILKHTSLSVYETIFKFQRTSESKSKYPQWIIKQNNTTFWIALHSCIIIYGTFISCIACLS